MTDETFAHRLRFARDLAGDLSGRELARLAGLRSEATVGLAETGYTQSMRLESALAVSRVLGVDPAWLATGAGSGPTAEIVRAAVAAARARFETESTAPHCTITDPAA